MSVLVQDATWRRLDARMLLVHPVNELVRFLPAVIGVFVIGSSTDDGGWWHVLGIALPILLGVLRFLTTSFRITAGQIELRHGLLIRNVLTAPLDRVRTVELTSSPIHRVLGLAKVVIGTGSASKSGSERLRLDSLSLAQARALRTELLHRTPAVAVATAEGVEEQQGTEEAAPTTVSGDDVLMHLDPTWVRYAPLTSSGVVLGLGALAATSQFSGPLLGRLADRMNLGDRAAAVPIWVAVLAALVAFVVVISVLAVLGYVLTNWGFTLSRDRGGRSFHVARGLMTTRETSIDIDRLRGLEVHEPLGLRLVGGGRLAAIVTGLGRRESGSTPIVPPAPRRVVVGVGELVLQEPGPFTVLLRRHGPAARRRRYLRALLAGGVLLAVVVLGIAFAHWSALLLLPAALVVVAGWLLARDRYQRLGHALTERYLVVRSGTFRGRRDALQRTGIIGWNLRETFFQRRAGLATLTATTSAGKQGYHLYDVPLADAVALADAAVPGLLGEFLRPAS